jgi:pimeloyl-ACP methyl ester carboxylesterase
MPYGELADGRLWTQTEWVGDDVLLIAGLADDASSWHAQVASLSTRFRVTVVDNGGAGRSSTPVAVALVGRRLRARELAAAAPERVRSLILNGSWVRSDERFRSLIDSLIAAVERVGSLRALIEVISLWVYPPALREDGTVERWLDAVEDVEGAAFRSVRDGLWRRRKRSGRMTQVSYRAGSASRRCSPWGRRTACCRSSTHARARGADPACDGHCVRGLRTPAVFRRTPIASTNSRSHPSSGPRRTSS